MPDTRQGESYGAVRAETLPLQEGDSLHVHELAVLPRFDLRLGRGPSD